MVVRLNKLIRSALLEMTAYQVPSSTGLIKLDAMENPYPLPDEIKKTWLHMLAEASLNRYPDATAENLKTQIKATLALPESCDLLLGNGSDELIQLLCLAVISAPVRKSDQSIIMAPEPDFVMYRQIALTTGLKYVGVPLQAEGFSLDMPAMLQAMEQHQPEILFLAFPNNPTGNLFQRHDCLQLIKSAPGLVVFDEAYQPFAQATMAEILQEYEHVLLLRTFSKLGLAGIRLGVLAGSQTWLQQIDKLRLPYNLNTLTQITAELACRHYDVFSEQAATIRAQRELLQQQLHRIADLQVFESQANFVLFRVKTGNADKVFSSLLEYGVLIKNMNNSHPLLKDCLRVTVGTSEENEKFLQALEQSI